MGTLHLGLALAISLAPVETQELQCDGGRMIFFERGSDQLNAIATQMLDDFVAYWRRDSVVGDLRIESGGDGVGPRFDIELSRRRSEALRTFFLQRGYAPEKVTIAIREDLDRPIEGASDDDVAYRMGWIARRIPREIHAQRYPPKLITECF